MARSGGSSEPVDSSHEASIERAAERIHAGDWRAAIHESGHALMSLIEGCTVDSISIEAGAGYDGQAHVALCKPWDLRSILRVILAGGVAVSFDVDCHQAPSTMDGTAQDDADIAALFDTFDVPEASRFGIVEEERLSVRTLLLAHWTELNGLACALVKASKLDAVGIRAAVGRPI
jgi:hypothetical protein